MVKKTEVGASWFAELSRFLEEVGRDADKLVQPGRHCLTAARLYKQAQQWIPRSPTRIAIRFCGPFLADPNFVFIEWGSRWRRVRRSTITRRKWQKRIIRCALCDNPAVRLDHFWPHHREENRCRKHLRNSYPANAAASS